MHRRPMHVRQLSSTAILIYKNSSTRDTDQQTTGTPGHQDATVLDGDIYFYSWPYPTVSPDGQWVAYISQGYVFSSYGQCEPDQTMTIRKMQCHANQL